MELRVFYFKIKINYYNYKNDKFGYKINIIYSKLINLIK